MREEITVKRYKGPNGKYNCPVCGAFVMDDLYGYDICPHCGWEDDDTDPYKQMGPNKASLYEARKIWNEHHCNVDEYVEKHHLFGF